MKIKSLTIQNIGLIKSETIKIDKPLILFYGEIKQGKTTILNCIRWAFGGSFPKDILTHGEEDGFIEIEFDNGLVNRSFYINKEGVTTARDLKIILNNRPAKVADLKRFLNPFLLNQNHLVDMKESERNKFIVELFQIETDGLDGEIIRAETTAQNLRSRLKAYGDVMPEFVKAPDFEVLEKRKSEIEAELQEQRKIVEAENEAAKKEYEAEKTRILNEIVEFNKIQELASTKIHEANKMLTQIHALVTGSVFEKCFDIECAKRLYNELPKPLPLKELKVELKEPTYTTVDESLLIEITKANEEAKVQQVKYENYLKEAARQEEKMHYQNELNQFVEQIRCMRLEKAAKQESINGIIEGLEYKDFQLWYENTSFEMLSTSQIMDLSSKLSALYPESLGLELIDRGESMGKSVLKLVEKAEKEEKNILVTIVGEKPAELPENIGVFVVEQGNLSK